MDRYTQPQWDRSVLLTIDTQEDFTRASGAACIPGTSEVLPMMQRLLATYRSRGRPIVHAVRLYERDGSNADTCRRAAIESGRLIATPGSPGAELAAELKADPSSRLDASRLLRGKFQEIGRQEWIVYKPRWGAFFETKLQEHLDSLAITTVVVAGCNFPNCPRTSMYEASERDYRVVAVSDAISGVYAQGLDELRNIGVATLSATEIVAAMEYEPLS